ncbi:glycosyltransferase [Paenibacillus sp. TRM 82003]|nr:glycosyltransferase [Paenibacillus sp. TRM 82003]
MNSTDPAVWLIAVWMGAAAATTGWLLYNLRQWPKLLSVDDGGANASEGEAPKKRPFVSVLVPARNESRNIRRCVESLLAQRYDHYEILVLDDRSEDDTSAIVEALRNKADDRSLRLLRGAELPAGWVGKSHACAQLAGAAAGEWLLFVDADTIHRPEMLERAIATARARGADLLTGFPRPIASHLTGKLVLPLLHFVIALHLPLRQVERSPKPMFVAAHGAFLLLRRETYEAIGGHRSPLIRSSLVEDMAIARATKAAGRRVALVDIASVVDCEMYERSEDVWNGFAKNAYHGIGRSAVLLLGLLLVYAAMYVAPLLACALFAATGRFGFTVCCGLIYLMGCWQKASVDRTFVGNARLAWLHPVSLALLVGIALRSWAIALRGRGYTWKGRVYRS